jgi:hypothetical protein
MNKLSDSSHVFIKEILSFRITECRLNSIVFGILSFQFGSFGGYFSWNHEQYSLNKISSTPFILKINSFRASDE